MTDWTEGYVADVNYPYGYYAELNPLRLRLAFLHAGLQPPAVGTACELGFGQGVSINMHACASMVQWAGTDFNPAQVAFAQEMAQAADTGARLYDDAFEQFCRRTDLPDFDYIGLHGIWSWVSDANRAVIVDFVRRKLKVGGVLYVSYNTQPGWAAMVPVRDLLLEHTRVLAAPGVSSAQRMQDALAFVEQLLATNPRFAQANPNVAQLIANIRKQDALYLPHEYLNRDWHPMPFSKTAQWLAAAKLQWACSANYQDAIAAINLSAEQQKLLEGIADPVFRQTVRDFCTNQQFRKDYWVKGARMLSALERAEALHAQRVMLVCPRAQASLKVNGSLGEATLHEGIHNPLLDELADHKPKSLGQLESALAAHNISWQHIVEGAMLLCGNGTLVPVQGDATTLKVKKRTERLNTWLITKARSSTQVGYLASPVTGGGVDVSRLEQLFVLARQQGHKTPQDWAAFAWSVLKMQGQRIVKEDRTLEGDEESVAEITTQAEEFQQQKWAVLRALQVI